MKSIKPKTLTKKNKKISSQVVSPIITLYKKFINDDISEIMKGSESVKYMRYNQWKNVVVEAKNYLVTNCFIVKIGWDIY